MDLEPRLQQIENTSQALVTKTDLAELRRDFAILRADVADIRADLHKAIAENARWTHIGTMAMFFAFILGAIGLAFAIYIVSKQAPLREESSANAAPTAPPVIVNIPPPQMPYPAQQPSYAPPAAQAPAPASN